MARWLMFPVIMGEIKSIIKMMKDKQAPKRYKFVTILGLIYVCAPIDLIPLPVLGFGLIDDLVVVGVILWYLKEPVSKYGEETSDKSKDAKKKYKGKRIIDVEEFTVTNDDKENQEDDKQ